MLFGVWKQISNIKQSSDTEEADITAALLIR